MANNVMSEAARKFIWKMIEKAAKKQEGDQLGKEAVKAMPEDFKGGFKTANKLITSN